MQSANINYLAAGETLSVNTGGKHCAFFGMYRALGLLYLRFSYEKSIFSLDV